MFKLLVIFPIRQELDKVNSLLASIKKCIYTFDTSNPQSYMITNQSEEKNLSKYKLFISLRLNMNDH